MHRRDGGGMTATNSERIDLLPEEELSLSTDKNARVLVLACGALAREVVQIFAQLRQVEIDLRCLPAKLHNTPQKIPELVREKLQAYQDNYTHIFVAYADCGTGGMLDRVLADFPHVRRLQGAHCYATYSGQKAFGDLMEEELGSFFLTDYMVRQFDHLIIQGMGLDHHPELRDMYFGNYRRVVYLAQTDDAELRAQAERAAEQLQLDYEYRYTGMGELADFLMDAHEAARRE